MPDSEEKKIEILPEKLKQNYSHTLNFDWVLFPYEIKVTRVYCSMLNKIGMLTNDDCAKISLALDEIKIEIDEGRFSFEINQPDIHSAIEAALLIKIGDLSYQLSAGRCKLDLISIDLRLWTKSQINQIQGLIRDLQKSILKQANNHVKSYMPAYTDLQPTQTITLAHQLLAYMQMFQRDHENLSNIINHVDIMPLGSMYGAGTTIPIDRIFLADALGFSKVSSNSLDAISDRDFLIEFLFCLSMIAQHMSRVCEDLILWSSEGFGFISFPEEFTEETLQTSRLRRSIVPELIRGKTGKVFGALHAALVAIKGLPTHYTRDCQEDKELAFETSETVQNSLNVLSRLFLTCTFNEENMEEAVRFHHWETLALVEYLIKNGQNNNEATKIVRNVVDFVIEKGIRLEQLSFEDLKSIHASFGQEVMLLLQPKGVTQTYASIGSSNPNRIKNELEAWETIIQ